MDELTKLIQEKVPRCIFFANDIILVDDIIFADDINQVYESYFFDLCVI
jgi:hypothetical protein